MARPGCAPMRSDNAPGVTSAHAAPPAHTLTLPGKSRYSRALGIRSPVPTSVMGTTGTLALAATARHTGAGGGVRGGANNAGGSRPPAERYKKGPLSARAHPRTRPS